MAQKKQPGKIVKHWKYRSQGTGQEIVVPLRWLEKFHSHSITTSSTFRVTLTDPCQIELEHKDPDELKKLVWTELDKFFTVDWKPHFEVVITYCAATDDSRIEHGRGQRLHLSYRRVSLGTRPNGDKVHKYPENSWLSADWPNEGRHIDGTFNDKEQIEMSSLIPDTPENKRNLDSIINALEALSKRIQDLMSPKKILATLANTHLLLPAPPKKGER